MSDSIWGYQGQPGPALVPLIRHLVRDYIPVKSQIREGAQVCWVLPIQSISFNIHINPYWDLPRTGLAQGVQKLKIGQNPEPESLKTHTNPRRTPLGVQGGPGFKVETKNTPWLKSRPISIRRELPLTGSMSEGSRSRVTLWNLAYIVPVDCDGSNVSISDVCSMAAVLKVILSFKLGLATCGLKSHWPRSKGWKWGHFIRPIALRLVNCHSRPLTGPCYTNLSQRWILDSL